MAIAATFAATLTDPHRGLPHNSVDIVFPEAPSTLLATAAVAASGLGTLVIYTSGRRRTQEIEASRSPPKTELDLAQLGAPIHKTGRPWCGGTLDLGAS
jgi:hypothetical protein